LIQVNCRLIQRLPGPAPPARPLDAARPRPASTNGRTACLAIGFAAPDAGQRRLPATLALEWTYSLLCFSEGLPAMDIIRFRTSYARAELI
jgi:hypothetical protein